MADAAGAAAEAGVTEEAIAEELFRDGVAALDDGDCLQAASLLSQCLQVTSATHGERSVKAASVCIKYGSALLASARAQGTTLLARNKVRCERRGGGRAAARPSAAGPGVGAAHQLA